MALTLIDLLATRSYPGRVCVAGRTGDGMPFQAYALTGRSPASRARALVTLPNGDVEVRDTGGGEHDALRHYVALARRGVWWVLGNGDQVVPIADDLAGGADLATAWGRQTFEPDPPIYTPRIWLVGQDGSDCTTFGWARRGQDGQAHRGTLAVAGFAASSGVLLSTYDGSVTDVETSAVPVEVEVESTDAATLGDAVWEALSPQLRVAVWRSPALTDT